MNRREAWINKELLKYNIQLEDICSLDKYDDYRQAVRRPLYHFQVECLQFCRKITKLNQTQGFWL